MAARLRMPMSSFQICMRVFISWELSTCIQQRLRLLSFKVRRRSDVELKWNGNLQPDLNSLGLSFMVCSWKSMCLERFIFLKQSGMSVASYDANIHSLRRHDTQLLTTKKQRIHIFVKGLNFDWLVLFVNMQSGKSFNYVSNFVNKEKRVR